MSPNESMEFLLDKLKGSKDNKEFLDAMNSWKKRVLSQLR
jgi:transcription termination factor Rho